MIGLSLEPTLEGVDRAFQNQLEHLWEGLGEKDRFVLELILREALNNAVLHGCQECGGTRVDLEYIDHGSEFWFKVTDNGTGFDWKAQSQLAPLHSSENGRGLPIFKAYCKEFNYNNKGNSLEVVYRFQEPRRKTK